MDVIKAAEKVKDLARELADPSTAELGFASTHGTDAARAHYVPAVLDAAGLASVTEKCDQAKTGFDWAAVKEAVGMLAGLVGKAALLVLLCLVLIGCASAPPEIIQAHGYQGAAMEAMKVDHDLLVTGLLRDLEDAWKFQDLLLSEAQTKAAAEGDSIKLAKLADIQSEARARQGTIREKIATIRGDDEHFQQNAGIAFAIHAAIGRYFARAKKGESDYTELTAEVADLASGIRKGKAK